MASTAELLQDVGAAAGAATFVWGVAQYAMQRRVGVSLTVKPEQRDVWGIRVTLTNSSPERRVQISDFSVLHSRGWLKSRVAVPAGPGTEPATPWTLEPDETKEGWFALSAVDGSKMGSRGPTWDFSRPIKVRAELPNRRGPTSDSFEVQR